jgi:hypothetical protein
MGTQTYTSSGRVEYSDKSEMKTFEPIANKEDGR